MRFSEQQVGAILDLLDARSRPRGGNRRAHPRFRYRSRAVVVRLSPAGGRPEFNYHVPTRNLSARAVSFLHDAAVPVGSLCTFELVDRDGMWHEIAGRVVRCTPVQDNIHEIAVRFHCPIDPTRFYARA